MGEGFFFYFGGGPSAPKPAAPKAALPAPAAIAPAREGDAPVETFTPEAERRAVARRPMYVLGSGQRAKTFGQKTTLGAGL